MVIAKKDKKMLYYRQRSPRRLSDFTDRREKSAGREQIFDRLKANSRSYLSKRVGNMVRSDDFAADSCKVRQPPN